MSVLDEVGTELFRARSLHKPMASAHEGWAVILEEVEELWDEVKRKNPDVLKMRAECIQIAAMAVRFVEDVLSQLPPPYDELRRRGVKG